MECFNDVEIHKLFKAQKTEIYMKNTTILTIIGILVLGIGAFIYYGSSSTGEVIRTQDSNSLPSETQKVVISEKSYNYYPDTITVKEGQPVEITLDNSVKGCLRSFNIKDLGVQGYSKNPSETIDFIPTKKGTFTFACSMGMGYGKIIVE